MNWSIDDKQAQSFAMDWATRASNSKIANLARCYLRAMSDLNKALGVIKQRAALPEGGSERALLRSLGIEPVTSSQFANK